MTDLQRITLETSKVRERLTQLAAVKELSESEVAEIKELEARYQTLEVQLRAATIADSAPRLEAVPEGRALLHRASVARFVTHAVTGGPVAGAEAELSTELLGATRGVNGGVLLPYDVLEIRTDVATTTAALDGPVAQRPILQRLFGAGILDALGISLQSVPPGRTEWPILTGGVTASATAQETAPESVVAVITEQTLKPKKLTGKYKYTVELAAEVAGMEAALRRDLKGAIGSAMSKQVLSGTGTAPQVTGLLTRITVPTAPTVTATYSDYVKAPASAVDGLHADSESQVTVLVGVATYKHMAGLLQSGSGESATETLRRRSGGLRATSYIPAATNAGVQNGNILHAGMDASRGDSIAAVWSGVELIRDPYTDAGASVSLTWLALWDCYTALRANAYARVSFKTK